ncbi:MAG: aminotransferase class IV family protein [Saprospirales bacterium]|nr:aminotransferase class IV family protein [Saprospirales bacterium]MBK8922282.1 aminotransferase class IV family protein [Saprospirales bacterium]
MPVNLNSALLDQYPEALEAAQRALFYGDALFETIRVFDGRMPYLERHWARLHAGMSALGFTPPKTWEAAFFRAEIAKLQLVNARVRLTVWRSPGGLFRPENDYPQFLIAATPLPSDHFEWPGAGMDIGLCTAVRLPVDAFSNFKTLNAPRYVAAAREAKAMGWDDALLLNANERVCEATSSNVFWWEKQAVYTVPLSEGCVAGVMREILLEISNRNGYLLRERPVTFAALQQADEIFLSNAIRGIIPVRNFTGKPLTTGMTRQLYESLLKYAALISQ